MKSMVDNVTGVLVLIPESEEDRLLLFHLMDCSQLNRFTEYLGASAEEENMTTDLGIEYTRFSGYLSAREPVNRAAIDRADREPELPVNSTALIGFNRER